MNGGYWDSHLAIECPHWALSCQSAPAPIADLHDVLLGRRNRPFIQTAIYGASWADLGHVFALYRHDFVGDSALHHGERDSLDTLCAASDTSWCSDGDTLWVKLVADETDAGLYGSAVSQTSMSAGKAWVADARQVRRCAALDTNDYNSARMAAAHALGKAAPPMQTA
jgi:hypothetical protein